MKQAGTELGQAQLKLELDFTLIARTGGVSQEHRFSRQAQQQINKQTCLLTQKHI